MNSKSGTVRYVAFLRGINVGGHHKVPMVLLSSEFEKLGFTNVKTLLNSGNVIFDSENISPKALEELIARNLEKTFGFAIPTIIRNANFINDLHHESPFREMEVTKNIRLYVTFLRIDSQSQLEIPWQSSDGSYKIIEKRDNVILSVLDLSVSKTTIAMNVLENNFGKDITTRNWNTIERIAKKI